MKKTKKILALACALTVLATPITSLAATENLNGETSEINSSQIFDNQLNLIADGQEYEETIIYMNPFLKASGTYQSTFDFKGGLNTKESWNCTSAPTFTVTMNTSTFDGHPNNAATFSIELQRKTTFSWKTVDSNSDLLVRNGGTVTVTGDQKGTYRIRLVNNSGFRATGNVSISYSY